MKNKWMVGLLAITMIFAFSCKKKRLVNDLCDCGDSQYEIKVNDSVRLIIPNIITPNWDNYNEEWELRGLEYCQNVTVTIVDEGLINRIVFESTGYEEMWDGTYKGKQLKDGKYFYKITFDGQTATGYVCIFTVMDLEHEYWDCLKYCEPRDGMDLVLNP